MIPYLVNIGMVRWGSVVFLGWRYFASVPENPTGLLVEYRPVSMIGPETRVYTFYHNVYAQLPISAVCSRVKRYIFIRPILHI